MSKSRVVELVEQNGNSYGQISSPLDLMKAQAFAHSHIEQLTRDFLTQTEGEIAGCNLSSSSGLIFNVSAGRIYRAGLQYESSDQVLAVGAADNQLARVDSVVAVLAADVPANTEFLAFQRLRSAEELNNNAQPYPPTQFRRATERHNVATIAVKAGTPAAAPTSPALAPDEVALYQITVPANAANLTAANIADVRKATSNLRAVKTQVEAISTTVAANQSSLLALLQDLADKLLVLKYRFPTVAYADGRCSAAVVQENGAWVIDMPVGTLVQFGDKFVAVEPQNFADASVNARYANASGGGGGVSYQHLVEDESIITKNNPSGNVVRFNAPAATKALYLLYDGTLVFRDAVEPSNGGQCLLLKIIAKQASAPTLKRYKNLRNGITEYTKVAAAGSGASKQFEMDLAAPDNTLYVDAFAIRASDKTRYQIPAPALAFDGTINVTDVIDGDAWVVRLTCLSGL